MYGIGVRHAKVMNNHNTCMLRKYIYYIFDQVWCRGGDHLQAGALLGRPAGGGCRSAGQDCILWQQAILCIFAGFVMLKTLVLLRLLCFEFIFVLVSNFVLLSLNLHCKSQPYVRH